MDFQFFIWKSILAPRLHATTWIPPRVSKIRDGILKIQDRTQGSIILSLYCFREGYQEGYHRRAIGCDWNGLAESVPQGSHSQAIGHDCDSHRIGTTDRILWVSQDHARFVRFRSQIVWTTLDGFRSGVLLQNNIFQSWIELFQIVCVATYSWIFPGTNHPLRLSPWEYCGNLVQNHRIPPCWHRIAAWKTSLPDTLDNLSLQIDLNEFHVIKINFAAGRYQTSAVIHRKHRNTNQCLNSLLIYFCRKRPTRNESLWISSRGCY